MADITSNLELHCKFDEVSGNPIDETGNYILSLVGSAGPTQDQEPLAGDGGRSIYFPNNSSVALDSTLAINASEDFSVHFFVYLDPVTSQLRYACGTADGSDGVGFMRGATEHMELRLGSGRIGFDIPELVNGFTGSIGLTRLGATGEGKAYIGTAATEYTGASNRILDWQIDVLGARTSSLSQDLRGGIDNFRVYKGRVLAQEDFLELATLGSLPALDRVDYPPYFIFSEGTVPEPPDIASLTWDTTPPTTQYDWSGVAFGREPGVGTGVERSSGATLITRRHAIIAAHTNQGSYSQFKLPDGSVYIANIVGETNISGDLAIVTYTADVPAALKVYSVMRSPASLVGYGMICPQWQGDVIMQRLVSADPGFVIFHRPSWQNEASASSGRAWFFPVSGELIFVGASYTANWAWPTYYFETEINTQLALAGSYALQMVDPPVVEPFVVSDALLTSERLPALGMK